MGIFISHITAEAPIAKVLKEFIQEVFVGQISVFVSSDKHDMDMVPGDQWLKKLEIEINKCDVMFIICSPYSLSKRWIIFEAGGGWAQGKYVIPMCHSGQQHDQLPDQFSQFQSMQLEFYEIEEHLITTLVKRFNISVIPKPTGKLHEKLIEAIESVSPPEDDLIVIESPVERTQLIINDLRTLKGSDRVDKETVWTSAFLSAFAISSKKPRIIRNIMPEKELELLLKEKELLLDLARKGCKIKCIISPANKNNIRRTGIGSAIQRTKDLLRFLHGNDEALNYIEFAILEIWGKNLYIIGNISCFEALKRGAQSGYNNTIRQTDQGMIKTNIAIYNNYFGDLTRRTMKNWGEKKDEGNNCSLLRAATVRSLENSLEFLKKERLKKE